MSNQWPTPNPQEIITFFGSHLQGFKKASNGEYRGICPFHTDTDPSLYVKADTSQWNCFGCNRKGNALIFAKLLNIPKEEVPGWDQNRNSNIVATYDYREADGTLVHQTVRFSPKKFMQRRPDGNGGWIWNLKGVNPVLYRLPELCDHISGSAQEYPLVFVPEGELDVENLKDIGINATCNPMGAGKWRDEYSDCLKGCDVVVIADKDKPGEDHAQMVAMSLQGKANIVKVIRMPDPANDVSDYLETGGTATDLMEMVSKADEWKPENKENKENKPTLYSLNSLNSQAGEKKWPPKIPKEALIGLPGKIIEVIGPETEADPWALLTNFLVSFGNVIGRYAYFKIGQAKHYFNLFAVLVGQSSKARKGQSWAETKPLFELADHKWYSEQIKSGLASGEGLIHHVRDALEKDGEIIDPGITDKRLLVVEEELSRTLRVISKDNNILSAVLRNAWDTGILHNLTKKDPYKSTGAHISVLGHITIEELKKTLTSIEIANGFGNRFLLVLVKRSKLLPLGGNIPVGKLQELKNPVWDAVNFASKNQTLEFDASAIEFWEHSYSRISFDRGGITGSLMQRAETQVLRIAGIYALLGGSNIITREHLSASLAFWSHVEKSVEYIYGGATGDPITERIYQALKLEGRLIQGDIFRLFGGHIDAGKILQVREKLLSLRKITTSSISTGGRNSIIWELAVSRENQDKLEI